MVTDLIFRIILGALFLVTLVTWRYYERKAAATSEGGFPGQNRAISAQIMRD